MGALLKVVDEHFGPSGAGRTQAMELRLVSERTTPTEIIRRRVEVEVHAANQRNRIRANDLVRSRSLLIDVEPGSPEGLLNRPMGDRKRRVLDVDRETARAIDAFGARRFIMLFDDKQVGSLQEEMTLMPASEVVFLYLSPLKGG